MGGRCRIGRIAGIGAWVATTGILASAALAEEGDDPDRDELLYAESSPYLIGTGNFMVMTQKNEIERSAERRFSGMDASADADDSWGGSGRIGYRILPRLAAEAQIEFVRNVDVRVTTDSESEREQIELMTLTGNAKMFLLTGRIQPYAIAGLGWGRSRTDPAGGGSDERDDGFVARFGAGVDLYGNRNVALCLEATYVYPATGGIKDLDQVSLGAGLMLRFHGD